MDELLQLIYPDATEYVDWHTLLVTLAQPYPIPSTQDLLNALNSYRAITNGDVLISRDQYDKVHNLDSIEYSVVDVLNTLKNDFCHNNFYHMHALAVLINLPPYALLYSYNLNF